MITGLLLELHKYGYRFLIKYMDYAPLFTLLVGQDKRRVFWSMGLDTASGGAFSINRYFDVEETTLSPVPASEIIEHAYDHDIRSLLLTAGIEK